MQTTNREMIRSSEKPLLISLMDALLLLPGSKLVYKNYVRWCLYFKYKITVNQNLNQQSSNNLVLTDIV